MKREQFKAAEQTIKEFMPKNSYIGIRAEPLGSINPLLTFMQCKESIGRKLAKALCPLRLIGEVDLCYRRKGCWVTIYFDNWALSDYSATQVIADLRPALIVAFRLRPEKKAHRYTLDWKAPGLRWIRFDIVFRSKKAAKKYAEIVGAHEIRILPWKGLR